jgi:hypothetical protein
MNPCRASQLAFRSKKANFNPADNPGSAAESALGGCMSICRLLVLSLVSSTCAIAQSPLQPGNAEPLNKADMINISPLNSVEVGKAPTSVTVLKAMDNTKPDNRCFTMRSYHFKVSPDRTDSLKPDGYSTCQAAAQFQSKDATATLK